MEATELERKQIEELSYIFHEHLDDIIFHPTVDKKTGEYRLSICVVKDQDDETANIYMLGVIFNPTGDTLIDRIEFKEDDDPVVTKRMSLFDRFINLFRKEK